MLRTEKETPARHLTRGRKEKGSAIFAEPILKAPQQQRYGQVTEENFKSYSPAVTGTLHCTSPS
jgi:hypothetical protein